MGRLQERVAYLKGLAEGLEVEKDGPEGRLLVEIINVLEDTAGELCQLAEGQRDMEEYINALDESVGQLEDDYWGYDGDMVSDDVFDDDDFIEMECPTCHGTVFFEGDILDNDSMDQITCPECGEVIFDFNQVPMDKDTDIIGPREE